MSATQTDRDVAVVYLEAGVRAASRCAADALCGHGIYRGRPDLRAMDAHVAHAAALRAVICDLREAVQ